MGTLISNSEMQSIEADFGEGPVTVYWRPQSLRQIDMIDQARDKSRMSGVLMSFLLRSLDANGKRMFDHKEGHPTRTKVENDFDADEVFRVVTAMGQKDVEAGDSGN